MGIKGGTILMQLEAEYWKLVSIINPISTQSRQTEDTKGISTSKSLAQWKESSRQASQALLGLLFLGFLLLLLQ